MIIHKRSLAAIVAAAALAVAPLTLAPSANAAAPYVTAPTLALSTTTPPCAGTLTVTGSGFVPGSTVTLTLHSTVTSLGSVVVNANGSFTKTVTLPAGVSGTHTIVAEGPPTATNSNRAEATITIGVCPTTTPTTPVTTPPPSPAAPPSKPSLAFTGVQIFGMVALVVVLLGIGGGLVYMGRRRRGAA